MNILNQKNNIPSARTSDKKHVEKSLSSRANEKNTMSIKKPAVPGNN